MRDFTWDVFRQTGDIEAYLLFKGLDMLQATASGMPAAEEEADAPQAAIGDEPVSPI